MIILCSPTKTMETENKKIGDPILFPEKTKELLSWIRKETPSDLQKMWKCSDKVLEKSLGYYEKMDLDTRGRMALDSFTGLFFKNIDAHSLPEKARKYLQNHLIIASGFYGLLRPCDGIHPYRLDFNDRKSLYEFWKKEMEEEFSKRKGPILNLASKEYGEDLLSRLSLDHSIIHIHFYEEEKDEQAGIKRKQKATASKIMRGRMIREMALQGLEDIELIKSLQINGYSFSEEERKENHWVFLKSLWRNKMELG